MTADPSASGAPLSIVFAGTPDFAAVALQALLGSPHRVAAVYTQPDRPAGRGRKPRPSPVKRLALEAGLPLRQPTTLKDADVQAELHAWKADVMVVAAYGLILPPAVLGIPRLGCLNIHASLLPRWRGAAPIQRALLAGDGETGVSIMQMEAGLDTGPVLHTARTPIEGADTAASLHDRLAELGGRALLEALDGVAAGRLAPVPQNAAHATYAAKLEKAEAELDWTDSAADLDRRIRAFNPWPVAQTHLGDTVLRVWAARALPADHKAEPGTILGAGPDGIDVSTGAGVLRLERVQLPGKKPVTAAALLHGQAERFAPGRRLGAGR